jgi:hypothetical protein
MPFYGENEAWRQLLEDIDQLKIKMDQMIAQLAELLDRLPWPK